MMKTPLYLIAGPTASGKSALALALARQRGGCIINADAMQVYAGLPRLTAQPSAQDRDAAPHQLYGMIPPAMRFSAALWRDAAEIALQQAAAAGQTPILVGGTGLYFRALLDGLAPIPAIADSVRHKAQDLYDAIGHDAFRARLAALDPASAGRIKPQDKTRLIRAFEVVTGTGRPLDYWHSLPAQDTSLLAAFDLRPIFIHPPRDTLYAACDTRFLDMFHHGAVEEVRALMDLALPSDLPAMKILGVAEIAAYLTGALSRDAAITKAQQMTRHYAKRQITWFKNQWQGLGPRVLTRPDLLPDL